MCSHTANKILVKLGEIIFFAERSIQEPSAFAFFRILLTQFRQKLPQDFLPKRIHDWGFFDGSHIILCHPHLEARENHHYVFRPTSLDNPSSPDQNHPEKASLFVTTEKKQAKTSGNPVETFWINVKEEEGIFWQAKQQKERKKKERSCNSEKDLRFRHIFSTCSWFFLSSICCSSFMVRSDYPTSFRLLYNRCTVVVQLLLFNKACSETRKQ